MKKYFLIMLVVIVGLSLTNFVSAADKDEKVVSTYEEVAIVFRSIPNAELSPEAETFCGFFGDGWVGGGVDLYSINTKGKDGSVVNWKVKKIGEALACTSLNDPDLRPGELLAYFQLTFGRKNPITIGVSGLCQITDINTPEDGILPTNCWLNVVSAPPEYVGGLLTSNTLQEFIPGTVTYLGYKARSIGTLRIFKERDAPGLIEDDDD